MTGDVLQHEHVLLPLTIILLSILTGAAINKLLFRWLAEQAQTQEKYQLFMEILRGIPIIWFSLIGIYIVLGFVPLIENLRLLLREVMLVLLLLSATIVAARLAAALIRSFSQTDSGCSTSSILINISQVAIYVMGFLLILQSLGISVVPILTALGVGGLAVALALQDTLSNLFSGLHIIASRKMNIGDYVKISSGEEGFIADISWRDTTIRTIGNNTVVVPNAKIASSIITNYFEPERQLSVVIPLGVSYDSDLKQVERVTLEVARHIMQTVKGGVANGEPAVRFFSFEESSINLKVILQADTFMGQYLLRHEFIKSIHQRFQQEGIQIPYPIRTIEVKKKGYAKGTNLSAE